MKKGLVKKSRKGFTLIELVVVIAILGILAAILIPVISGFIQRANEAADLANARMLYSTGAMVFTDPALNYGTGTSVTFNSTNFSTTTLVNGINISSYLGTVWPESRVDPNTPPVLTVSNTGEITVTVSGKTFDASAGSLS